MEIRRRKLFSTPTPRRKLFSEPTVVAVCHDCGCEITTGDETTTKYCPECGGKRFDIPAAVTKHFSQTGTTNTRRKLFSGTPSVVKTEPAARLFSDFGETEFESLLGEWEGKEMDSEYALKVFSGVDLVSEGLATESEGEKIKVFSMAKEMEKMFSTLKITVIRELCLDPIPGPDPCCAIDNLASEQSIPAKTIVLMKKAHSLPKEAIVTSLEGWAKDSGLREDLKEEFGDKDFTEDKLRGILKERYEDAPGGILDYLKESGIVISTPEGNLHIKK